MIHLPDTPRLSPGVTAPGGTSTLTSVPGCCMVLPSSLSCPENISSLLGTSAELEKKDYSTQVSSILYINSEEVATLFRNCNFAEVFGKGCMFLPSYICILWVSLQETTENMTQDNIQKGSKNVLKFSSFDTRMAPVSAEILFAGLVLHILVKILTHHSVRFSPQICKYWRVNGSRFYLLTCPKNIDRMTISTSTDLSLSTTVDRRVGGGRKKVEGLQNGGKGHPPVRFVLLSLWGTFVTLTTRTVTSGNRAAMCLHRFITHSIEIYLPVT